MKKTIVKGLLTAILLIVSNIFVFGNIIYVDSSSTALTPGGTSWTDAYPCLQTALTNASANDQIRIAKGTYYPDCGSGDRTASFYLPTDVTIYGGYNSATGQLDFVANKVVLSGEIGLPGTADDSYHVFNNSGATHNGILYGVHIVGGNANGTSSPNNSGGGMYNDSASPLLINCVFSNNNSSRYGGAVYNTNCSPRFYNVTFDDNDCDYYGGGMYNTVSLPYFNNCHFTNNTAGESGGGMSNNGSSNPTLEASSFVNNDAKLGGGMYNNGSAPQLSHVSFKDNLGTNSGGGMYNYTASPNLSSCTFTSNTAGSGGGMANMANSSPVVEFVDFENNVITNTTSHGAGMYNAASSPYVAYCKFISNQGGGMCDGNNTTTNLLGSTFKDNTSTNYGGGHLVMYASNVTITNCTYESNTASTLGGGLCYLPMAPVNITGSTFNGNSAPSGGGIAVLSNSGTIENCEIYGNTSTTAQGNNAAGGGGIYLQGCDGLKLMKNTIYSNNGLNVGGGLCIESSNNIKVENNTFYDNQSPMGGGIGINNPTTASQGLNIINNLIYKNLATVGGGICFWAISPTSGAINSNTIVNNTAIGGDGMFSQNANVCTFSNNIIYYNGTLDVCSTLSNGGSYTLFTNNDIRGCNGANGNLDLNPQFVNMGADDYRISSVNGSPCINTGTNAASRTALDNKGDNRVIHTTIDMGAFEYEGVLGVTYRMQAPSSSESSDITCDVYPNPAVDQFRIELDQLPEEAQIRMHIMDVNGKLIRAEEVNATATHTLTQDVSMLERGIYFVDVWVNNNQRFTTKLVITR